MGKNLCPAISLGLAVGGVSAHDPLLRMESGVRERPKRSASGRRLNREMVAGRKRVDNRVSTQAPKKEPVVIRGAAWWQKHWHLPTLVAGSDGGTIH